ncbi:hypothetical protein M2262_005300 [Pseudomonas sp. BIGb0408]|uniref:Ig-like domain (Group 3) n=1 Tax=Phytopseudomonas flavescens TaxID=29435 RepID=A0A7Y9XQ40_9GAMM|nr:MULTISPECIES: Ig-like domain-containing protein [Pseudomonas]MCW2295250.1 hypothetical protein [Pseudomonas sp. BIGb0408]NYH75476.1 hypothetical protein [Pseudomonas flavescens]
MAVQAKVAPIDQQVAQATERTVSNTLPLSQSSNVALNIAPESVASYSREGMDLVVQMQDGEVLRISNFYSPVEQPSQLFLVGEEEQLIAVDLSQAASDGILAASYASETTLSGFTSLTSAAATTGGALGLGTAALIGGVAIAGGVVVADEISSRDSNNDNGGATPVAPSAASSLQVSADGRLLTGSAEAGTTVRVDVNGDGNVDYTATVDNDGRFVVSFVPPLTNGEAVSVVVVNAAGATSPAAQVAAPDISAPDPASQLQVSAEGDVLTGLAEPGARVEIDLNGDGIADSFAIAGPDGRFTFTLNPPLVAGETIAVWVIDGAGNQGQTATIAAPNVLAPEAPTVEPSNGAQLTGTAPPDATVEFTNPDGSLLGQTTADANGNWTFTPNVPWADGALVDMSVINVQGIRSPIIRIVIDRSPPDAPTVEVSNGTLLSGTAEANSTITLTIGSNPAVTVTTDASGLWYYSPAVALADGTLVSVVATDRAGNSSPPTALTIDASPPLAPQIGNSNGVVFSGTAEAGSTLILSAAGAVIGQTLVDANGNWSFTASPPVANGILVSAAARDAAGNTGPADSVTVDDALPNAPVITASNGTVIAGTADAGSIIIVRDANGGLIGQTTANGSGAWSITPAVPLANGSVINAIAQNAQGDSASTTIAVDAAPPQAPVVQPSNGEVLTGTAEAGAKIILIYSNGQLIGQTSADADGNWSFIPTTPLSDGTSIEVTARDAVGNTSLPATVVIDRDPPTIPTLDATDGITISGSAEAGSTVTVSGPGGVIIGATIADANGNWSITPTQPLGHDTPISVSARDQAGNVSVPATGVVDAEAPQAPTLAPSRGNALSGTAEPGSTVIITIGNEPAVQVSVGNDGNWTYLPGQPIANGTPVTVVAQDPSGNSSTPVSGSVDSQPPAAPVVHPSNGDILSGTAEPGSTVTVTTPGNPEQTATTDANGNWTVTPTSPLPNGASVAVTATDAAGNQSTAGGTIIDIALPARPTIAPSNGSALSGTATAGATVVLTGAGGVAIGQTSADANGVWNFSPAAPLANGTSVSATVNANGVSSAPAITVIDSIAPATPTIQPSDGSLLTGTAEAGSTLILTGPGGTSIGQATANDQGVWTFQPGTALANGTLVSVVARDAAGNQSAAATTTTDGVAPQTPTLLPSSGTLLSGTAEAGSTLIVSDANGRVIGRATADANGNWTLAPSPALADNAQISVVARDAAGNTSPSASVIIDASAPAAPLLDPSNGRVLSGSAEPGSTLTIRDLAGNLIAETVVGANGTWSIPLATPIPNAAQIRVIATDASGNASPAASLTIDSVAPAAPTVALSNGSEISGSAEPGSTVILTGAGGASIGQVTADANGNWTFIPTGAIGNGTQVSVVARDAAGNTSAASSVTIDSQAPNAPSVGPSNGTLLSGTGEAGTLLIISVGGAVIGQTLVAADGTWSFTPPAALPDGTAISIVARDATGNQSASVGVTIDALTPATPVIQPSNGSFLSGSAEAGSTVLITGPGGVVIGQTIADGNNTWAFTPTNPLLDGTQVTVVARDSAGNTSAPAAVIVDAVVPATPTLAPSDGKTLLSGTAEPGTTLLLTIGTAPAIEVGVDSNGVWTYPLSAPLADLTPVRAVARDASGNFSPVATIEIDAAAPGSPVIVVGTSTLLSGTAEAGSTVSIKLLVNGQQTEIGSVVADAQGNWSFSPTPPNTLIDGNQIQVTATDAAGNISQPSAIVTIDTNAPLQPSIDASNGSSFSGIAEAGSIVIITGPGGVLIGQATADVDGGWTFSPANPLLDGTPVTVVARDASGNTSPSATVTVDAIAPGAPTISPSDGRTTLSGTAEPGSTLLLGIGGAAAIEIPVDQGGNWSYALNPALGNGITITVSARDAAGNTGPAASTTIDNLAPDAPDLYPSNGLELSGTGEPGTTITVTSPADLNLQATVDANGNWTIPLGTPLPDNTSVSVIATDAAGNQSGPATISVEADLPARPTIDPSNGLQLSGTAPLGTTVILTAADGTSIGQASVNAQGEWSFTPPAALPNGAVVTAVANDGVNDSAPATSIIDSIAPAAPTIDPSNGSLLSGTAEAGSTVILSGSGGIGIGQVIADANGNWTFTPGAALSNGTLVTAVARDAAGNTSASASTTIDNVAPDAPTLDPSNGTLLSGTAQAGISLIVTDANGRVIGQTTADANGNWSLSPSPALANASVVTVVARDVAGNISAPASTAVDAVAPGVPTLQSSNGITFSGSAEAGSTVIITGAAGAVIGQVVADAQGNWTFTPPTAIANGTVVTVVARDAAGNTSGAITSTIDAVAPNPPTIGASNGTQLSGTAEAGATVILTGSGGVAIGQVIADANGNWAFTPGSALANGTVVTAVARDAAGNTSGQAATIIDALAPATPTIDASNGTQLGGSAEAGSTVVVTDANGRIIGQATATADGTWTLTPSPALPNGALISAVARDAVGNTSAAVSTTIDSVAPVAPTISPSNGIELSGTAEAGSTVIITGPGGSIIGQTSANAGGTWSFTPTTAVPNGTQVSVVSRDAAGNTSPSASTVIDSQVPDHPTVNPSNGVLLSGTAEANSTVIITGPGGAAIGTTTANASGNWSFTPASALANGTLVTVVARDALGNQSAPASTLIDSIAPSAPLISPSNGLVISGSAEAGSTVTVRVAGNSIGTALADANGNWSLTPGTALSNATQISATATDVAGNVSTAATATVDAQAPGAPTIGASNGVILSGTAEAGSTVIITGAGGVAIGQAQVDAAGNWSFIPPVALTNTTQVTVVARDAAGNTGPSASLVIDTVAPVVPTVQPSNGVSLTGTAEAGSTVILTGPGGVVIGQTIAGPGGAWSFSPQTPLQHGAQISVSARDAAGNTGASASVSIDAVAPVAPTIDATNGVLLRGTAEAGSTVILTTANGSPLATLTADANGAWSLTPGTALGHGTLVTVVSRDAAGNLSASASTSVDAIAPQTPFIAASNGVDLSGTAEAGSTVRLSVGGVQIAQVIADANGNWHFTPPLALPDNTLVTAIAVDAAGNTSGSASVTVDDSGPDLPVVEPSNGSLLSGSAEPGSTITVSVGGQQLGQTIADPITGNWVLPVSPAIANGTSVSVTATDATNNVSAPAIIVIDSVPPAVPTIQASNGTLLTGTAEAGSTVILTGPGGVPIGITTATASGSWSLNPGTPLANGTQVTVVARDAANNTSPSASVTVDAVAPAAPTILASNGTLLSGSAEVNSTVILTGPGGVQIGTTTANGSGAWSFSPSPALANGVVVTAIARDAAGNNSGSVSTTIDAVAPVAPTIQPSNGALLSGTAEAGSTVLLTGAGGAPIGTALTNASGNWSFAPGSTLSNGTVVKAVARDAAGNTSGSISTTIDGVAPVAPTIQPSKGTLLTGTAEAGSTVILTGPGGAALGQTTANAGGAWSFTPAAPLANGTTVTVVARDAAGNTSTAATTNIDSQAPNAPSNLFVTADGTLLTGNAEAGSQVRIVVNGNVANPITVTATAAGTFAAILIPALVAGQPIGVTAIDAAGNVSASAGTNAPNLSAPTISVAEAADTYINAAEAADGIQVRVGLATGVRAGDVVTVTYTGTGGYQFNQAHTVTAAEALAGSAVVSVVPPAGSFPQGAASVTAHVNNGANSQAANFTVDTIAPSSPVLGLVGNLLTISGEPNSELTVRIDLGGTVATATVTANNAGLASVNLLTGLNIGLSYDQLLSAQVSVSARDQAGNQSNVATLGLGTSLQQQPITLGNLAVDANLNLLNLPAARLGVSGKTVAGAALAVEVLTPVGYIGVAPLAADANGNFSLNLLSPTVLSQLGLSLTNILNLGGDLALRITATSAGKTSGVYTVDLDPLGLLGLTIGSVRVDGTAADDILSGNATIAGERIFAGLGNDLILNVGSGDRVDAGAGNDTIQIKATNFGNVDGGTGFDTVVFDGGIDINYGAAGIGTFSNIERIDLGTGDSGSTLTLTAAAVDAMTDSRNTLQITGESNDVLNLTASALKTGAQQIDGITYDVYTYGSTTLLVEENTVQVVVS